MPIHANRKNALLLTLCLWVCGANATTVSEPRFQFQPIQIDTIGPDANEADTSPNPFLDIRFDLMLEAPSGRTFTVPGFFAGDGNGNEQGKVWRARFNPDEMGEWRYTVRLLSGANAAVLEQTDNLTAVGQHNDTGVFTVSASVNANGLEQYGRLSYVGEHYLKFSNGSYWIKGGLDSPENFFGYSGFDNTINQPGGVGEGQLSQGLHHYTEHVADWNAGDPLFSSKDSGVDSKGIIGAVNYLASEGINSLYFLLMNLGGDGRDTYPFTGPSGNNHDNTHYDISKLRQWNIVMEHMQAKGIAAHLVLGEQEQLNRDWLDNGELGVQRKLFYREMVARFTHLNALKWNVSEESRYGTARHKSFAQTIRNLDWAKHPIAVHSFVDRPDKQYDPLLGNPLFTISSIQFSAENAGRFTETWRKKSREAGTPWVIDMDEVGPGNIGLTDSNSDKMRREVLYPVYFSGGNIEWYFGFQGADIRTENFRTRESMYRYMRYAREFIEEHLPFWEMHPDDKALVGADVNDQVFAKPGVVYALYLNSGNGEPVLNVESGSYTIQWFNPRTGQMDTTISKQSGDRLRIGASPSEPQQDWVVLIRSAATENNIEDNGVEVDLTDGMAESVEHNPAGAPAAATNEPDTLAGETATTTETAAEENDNTGSDTAQPAGLVAQQDAQAATGYTSSWFSISVMVLLLVRLLLGFRCRCVLTAGFNVLRV